MVNPSDISDLPRFDVPPIDEVAIGLLFDRLPGFSDLQAGLFWRSVKTEYPRSLSRPRIDEEPESLTSSPLRRAALPSFEILDPSASLGSRTWLVSEDDSRVLQIQDTHFLRNWRRRGGSAYPHLDSLVADFWLAYERFLAFLDEESTPNPNLRQVELSYFNWIPLEVSDFFRPIECITPSHPGMSPTPELAAWKTTYLDYVDGQPAGRLWIDLQTAGRQGSLGDEEELGYRLSLSYRSPMRSPSREEVDAVLERGRRLIDCMFVDLTTPDAQERWRRTQ